MSETESVIITLKDVYIEMMKIRDAVQELESPAKAVVDHEVRIRGLERWRYSLPASLAVSVASIILAAAQHK